ncbi:hypothetical protein BO70DRAFT_379624 [Aspergillus heteromorphus CBS 117.55]|uniref:FAR1 domain-containing protein n=1 Tax=Aspergillus heteromorphus CBS 117.55 TaxID=1448321 RepID=A0A317W644_9EURO|nr:uncharacterized protein BO70DRAFT_379624 [Aspergillus heteromorphus CBS 117.55]PWY82076.1 hypothetical protein BO70DRAFT_379624 [Aspergillus heteromorphus CBS 117.55]
MPPTPQSHPGFGRFSIASSRPQTDTATPPAINPLLPPPPEQWYATQSEALEKVRQFSESYGYTVVRTRSNKGKDGQPKSVYLICDRGLQYESRGRNIRTRRVPSRRIDCPFSMVVSFHKREGLWLVKVRNPVHNHPPEKGVEGEGIMEGEGEGDTMTTAMEDDGDGGGDGGEVQMGKDTQGPGPGQDGVPVRHIVPRAAGPVQTPVQNPRVSMLGMQSAGSTLSTPQIPDSAPRPERIRIAGLRDVAVKAYCEWQESYVQDEGFKAEFRKARDVALENALDLEQIHMDQDPGFFMENGVKKGIARRFVDDIKEWASMIKE